MKKLFVVTRRDLPLGAQAAQLVHAAREYAERHPVLERRWYEGSNTIALLTAADASELEALVNRAIDRDIPFASFHEPDLGGALTAVAFGDAAAGILRGLPLAFV